MAAESHGADIPVWFNGTQRWMTGVTRRTTCDDVIYALLVSTGLHETESTDTFAIFEKWREVERPLSARTKILKVWSFWGEEQPNVQLSMRSLEDYFLPGESSLYTRSRRRHKKSTRHKERHSTQCRHHNKPENTECSRFRTLEQLVKLVVSQERKIQDLGDRIQETDTLIDKHEARIHLHRVQQNGMDYVQNSYLNSHSSESSSNSSADTTSFTSLDPRELKAIFPESNFQQLEEIARVCDNVGHIEQCVAQEQAKIQELTKEAEKLAESTGAIVQLEGENNTELEEARVQMIRAVATYVTNEYNERELDRKIDICLAEITAKTEYINEMQRKIYEAEQRNNYTELSERRARLENNSNSQRLTSVDTPPLLGPQGFNLVNSHNDTRCERPMPPILPADDNQHNPNRNRNLYNISGQFLRSLHLDKEALADSSATFNKNSPMENGVFQEKSPVVSHNHMNRVKYNDGSPVAAVTRAKYNDDITVTSFNKAKHGNDLPVATFNKAIHSDDSSVATFNRAQYSDDNPIGTFSREGRSIRRSNRALQRPMFIRSRSAERSTDASKSVMNSDYGRVNGSGKSESRTTKAIVDQYGLEMNIRLQGSSCRDSLRSKNNIFSNTPSNFNPATAYKQNQPQETNQLVNSNSERRYQQHRQEMGRHIYQNGISMHTDVSYNDGSSRGMEGNSHLRSGSQIVSHDHARDLRTCVNNQHTDRTDAQSASVFTFGGQENRIPGGEDTFFKERSLFEQNIRGSPRSGSDSSGDRIYRGAIQSGVRNSPTPNRTFDLTKPGQTDLPDSRNGYNSRLLKNNIQLSSNCENVQLPYETEGIQNITQFSSSSKYGIITHINHENLTNPIRNTGDSQTERQTRIQQATGDIYKQGVKENNPTSFNPCLKFQASNQHMMPRDSSPRQQRTSRLTETYSPRAVSEDTLLTHPNRFPDAKWDDRNGMRHQNESGNKRNNIDSTQQLPDTTAGQHKKLHFSTDVTTVQSNGVIREKISGAHSLSPAVKFPVTPKIEPSLLSNKETAENSIPGEGSGSANRGALYHIVSNKMNKTKSGSPVYQHDKDMNGIGSSASPTQHLVHKKPNTDLVNSVSIQKDISQKNITNQNNREHSGNNPSSFSLHKSENNAHPSTFSNITGHPNHTYSGYNKDTYSLAPFTVSNTKNKTGQASYLPTNSAAAVNHAIYDKAASTEVRIIKQNINTPTSLGMNSTGKSQSSSILSNSVNHTNGFHTGGYSAGLTNSVTIHEIHKNLSNAKGHPPIRGHRVDVGVRKHAADVSRTKLEDVNDSNSDTGLSSMHSDETPTIETLV